MTLIADQADANTARVEMDTAANDQSAYTHCPSTMGLYSSYYSYGLPSFAALVIALYLLFTGQF